MEPISKIKCDHCKRHFTHEWNPSLRDESKLLEEAVVNQLVIHATTPGQRHIATIQEKVQRVTFHCPICNTERGGHIDIMSDMAFDYVFADWHETK